MSGGARGCVAIALALSITLHTVNGFSQVSKALVRVHAFGYALPRMTKNHARCRLVSFGTVEQSRECMPCLMWRVMHPDGFHGSIPETTEAVISRTWAYLAAGFPLDEVRQYFVMDGDFADACRCLAVLDVDVSLPRFDVSRSQREILTDAHPCVDEDEDVDDAGDVCRAPKLANLAGSERPLLEDWHMLRQFHERA